VPARKVAVTIDTQLLREVDGWVAAGDFPNRSRAVQAGLDRLRKERAGRRSLLAEIAKLDPEEERAMAGERLAGEAVWPEF
jgi:Arc/MetJ-type ribon-helix-helix transcriptional regulator